jgi:hypothetical protein
MITIAENISKTMYMRRKREFSEPIEDYSGNHDEIIIRQEKYY